MAFNLGRFAAGLAQGGIQTYTTLSEIEQKKKELALREEAAARERTEYERKLAVDKILAEASAPEATVGTGQSMSSVAGALPIAPKGGQYDNPEYRQAFINALSKMTPEQQQSTLRQYGSVMPEGVGGAPAQQGGMRGAAVPARSAIDLGKATTYKGDDGQIYVTDKTRTRSQDEIGERFMELAGKSGSSLAMEKAMDYKSKQTQIDASKQALRVGEQSLKVGEQNLELGAKNLVLADISIGAAKREQNYRENLDKFSERTLKTQEILETLPNVGLKEAPALVNGALKDFGLTAKYIEPTGQDAIKQAIGKVQMGKVEVRDSKGKVVGIFNSVADIQGALNGQMEQYHNKIATELVQMLPNPADRIKFMNDARAFTLEKAKVDIMARQAGASEVSAAATAKNADTSAAELEAKIKSGLFPAQANQANAAATASNAAAIASRAHAGVYNNMVALSKKNAEAGEAMKPYIKQFEALTPEQQRGPEGEAVLLKAATAAANKSGDITGLINALTKGKTAANKDSKLIEELGKKYAEDIQAARTPNEITAINKKYSDLGLDTGYVDPTKGTLPKVGENLNPDAGKNTEAIPKPKVDSRPKVQNVDSELQIQARSKLYAADVFLKEAEKEAQAAAASKNTQTIIEAGKKLNAARAAREEAARSPFLPR
jgi:hypothetical protein